MHPAVLSNFT
ncbi:hypothetical protein YPPY103_1279, partial [Yersinia pestis PY-103]